MQSQSFLIAVKRLCPARSVSHGATSERICEFFLSSAGFGGGHQAGHRCTAGLRHFWNASFLQRSQDLEGCSGLCRLYSSAFPRASCPNTSPTDAGSYCSQMFSHGFFCSKKQFFFYFIFAVTNAEYNVLSPGPLLVSWEGVLNFNVWTNWIYWNWSLGSDGLGYFVLPRVKEFESVNSSMRPVSV